VELCHLREIELLKLNVHEISELHQGKIDGELLEELNGLVQVLELCHIIKMVEDQKDPKVIKKKTKTAFKPKNKSCPTLLLDAQ
jgi:hypothetical protein